MFHFFKFWFLWLEAGVIFSFEKYFEILHIYTFFGKYQVERFFFLSSGMAFTEWFPGFDKKALAFKILLTQRAVEALRMIVVV